jgi:hypothetical protein
MKGTTVKILVITTLAAGALSAAGLGLAGAANSAPSGPSTVHSTISHLQSQGYQVIVNRVGAGELSMCSVSAIRAGQQFTQHLPVGGGDAARQVVSKTAYVDVRC